MCVAAGDVARLGTERRGELVLRGRRLPLGERTLVMGIINHSPDSFSGDGLADPAAALERADRFIDAGADLLDIGAMSTRPGSAPIPEGVEAERLRRALGVLRRRTDAPLSADTYRPGPARAALEAGADALNDVTGLRDPNVASLAAEFGAGVVVMHMRGDPRTMQADLRYDDLAGEVRASLDASVRRALDAGVAPEAILVDPGIGFGKGLEHNLELLHRLREFRGLGAGLLVGVSRKSFIGRLTGREAGERTLGTAAAVALAVAGGADVVRVHDVREMVEVVRVADAISRWAPDGGSLTE